MPVTTPRKRPVPRHRMSDVTKLIWITLGVVALFAIFTLLGGVIFMAVTWNLGVVGLAAALGYTVAKIGFWTAVGANFVCMTLGIMFNGQRYWSRGKDSD